MVCVERIDGLRLQKNLFRLPQNQCLLAWIFQGRGILKQSSSQIEIVKVLPGDHAHRQLIVRYRHIPYSLTVERISLLVNHVRLDRFEVEVVGDNWN